MGIADRCKRPSEFGATLTTIYANPGVGKTTAAARIGHLQGKHNIFLTDEQGIQTLSNHPELEACSEGIQFESLNDINEIVVGIRTGELPPNSHIILDTLSGIQAAKITEGLHSPKITEIMTSRVHKLIPEIRDYQLSSNMLGPIMPQLAACGIDVTVLCHLKVPSEAGKKKAGDLTRPDVTDALMKVVNKYSNVVAYMRKSENRERMFVVEGDNRVMAKTQIHMSGPVVTDDEFVETIAKWRSK